MANHGSATVREHTPHVAQTSRPNISNNALKRRAQAVINDTSIDPQSRAIIRYALEINDPLLPELVRRADAGEMIDDNLDFAGMPETNAGDSIEARIEALIESICGSSRVPEATAIALLVLVDIIENSLDPRAMANAAKHCVFTWRAEDESLRDR